MHFFALRNHSDSYSNACSATTSNFFLLKITYWNSDMKGNTNTLLDKTSILMAIMLLFNNVPIIFLIQSHGTNLALSLWRREWSVCFLLNLWLLFFLHSFLPEFRQKSVPGLIFQLGVFCKFSLDHQSLEYESRTYSYSQIPRIAKGN